MRRQDGMGLIALALRRRWVILVLVAVPLAIGAIRYAETLPDEYQGRAVVSFAPQDATSADVVSLLLPKYQEYVSSEPTLTAVAAELGQTIEDIDRGIAVSIPPETSNLEILVARSSPDDAADTANALAAAAVAFSGPDPLLEGTLIASALPARAASGPPRRLIEIAAVLMALLIGGAAAVLADRLRPTARTPRDISRGTGVPVVGVLPLSPVVELPVAQALADPEIGAQVRILRTNLAQAMRGESFTTVLVTSPARGGGKTTVASLFAAAAALPNERVLLIDGDLLRPGLAARIGVPSAPGLVQLLQEDQAPDRFMYTDTVPGLAVLPTETTTGAGDLVTRRFGELLADLRYRYDLVVIDAPPLEGNDLARQLATMADGVLLVVPSGSPMSQVTDATEVLRTLGVRILGAVANGMPPGSGPSYPAPR